MVLGFEVCTRTGTVSITVFEDLFYQRHPFEFSSCFPRNSGSKSDNVWNVSPTMLQVILYDEMEIPVY